RVRYAPLWMTIHKEGVNRKSPVLRLILSADLVPRPRQNPPLRPGQAAHSFPGNFIEQRIDFLCDELFRSHGSITLGLRPALGKRTLEDRRPAEAEKMGVKPTRDGAAEERAVR